MWLALAIGIGTAIGSYLFLGEIEKKAKEIGIPVNKEMILGGGLLLGSYFLKQADLKEPASIMGLAGAGFAGYGIYKYLKEKEKEKSERKYEEEIRKQGYGIVIPKIYIDEIKKERFTICEDPFTQKPKEVEENVIKLTIYGDIRGNYPETIYHLHIHSKMIGDLVYVHHPTDGVLFDAYSGQYICFLPYQKGRLYFHRVGNYGIIEVYGIPINQPVEIHFSIRGCFKFFGWRCLTEDKIHVRTWSDNVYINCCTYPYSEIANTCQFYNIDIYDRLRYPARGTCSKECIRCFEDKNKRCIEENPDFDIIKCETEEVEVL